MKQSNHRPILALDDVNDVDACIALLRFLRDQRRKGQRFYFFVPTSAVGECLCDLQQTGLVEVTPGETFWMAEVVR